MRQNGDHDLVLNQHGDTDKLKDNSFYGKMIEDLMKHLKTTFTANEELVDKVFRLPFFEDLEEINGAFEIRESKQQVHIVRPYRCNTAIYQLAKLCTLEFYYDFVNKYLDRFDFHLIQMDTDAMYMAISGMSIDNIIRPKLRSKYDNKGKAEFLSTS